VHSIAGFLHLRAGNGVLRLAAGIAPALGRQSLVAVGTQVQAKILPGVEMALRSNGSASWALVAAVADVLPESCGPGDGRLVDLLVLPDVVDGAVTGHAADLLALSRAGSVAGVFLDVVLNQRTGGPTVHGNKNGPGGGTG